MLFCVVVDYCRFSLSYFTTCSIIFLHIRAIAGCPKVFITCGHGNCFADRCRFIFDSIIVIRPFSVFYYCKYRWIVTFLLIPIFNSCFLGNSGCPRDIFSRASAQIILCHRCNRTKYSCRRYRNTAKKKQYTSYQQCGNRSFHVSHPSMQYQGLPSIY